MKYHLRFIQGPLSGQTFELGRRALSIGRSKNACDIKIDSPTVSSRHATIQLVGDKIMLTVISQHTTLIDGKRVPPQLEPYPVALGSQITLGADSTFIMESLGDAMDGGQTMGNEAVHTDNPAATSLEGQRTATVSASSLPPNAKQVDPNATGYEVPLTATVSASSLPPNAKQVDPNATGYEVPLTATVSASNLLPNAKQADPNATGYEVPLTATVSAANQAFHKHPAGGAAPADTNRDAPADQTGGGTVAMGTNRLTPDQIKKIIEEQKQKERQKIMAWTGGLAFALLILIIIHYFIANKPPMEKLEWPQSGKTLLIARHPLECPGYEKQLTLIYPSPGASKPVEKDAGKILINTCAGQSQDVILRILVEYNQDIQLLHLDREDAFKAWQKAKAEKNPKEGWVFEPTLPLKFARAVDENGNTCPDNGLPYLSAFYTRKRGEKKVFGIACYFRQADMQLVILVYIDEEERSRGESFFLNHAFLECTSTFASRHWEGRATINNWSLEDNLSVARELLRKKSPITWGQIEDKLQAALITSYAGKKQEQYDNACEMLAELRRHQIQIYNNYRIEVRKVPEDKKQGIRDLCAGLFLSPDDRRYYQTRDKRWGK